MSEYNNVKVKMDGEWFDSHKEGMRYRELQLMVTEDPAPLPMRDEEDADLRAAYPADPEPAEDENWTK